MKQNMGIDDRSVRLALAVLVIILYLTGVISGVVAIILGVLAFILLATSLLGFCPLYLPFKISTK